MAHLDVLGWVMLAALAAGLNAIWNPNRYAISLSLLIVACSMFAYTSVLVNSDNPVRWFADAPPKFVSRITVAAVIFVSMVGLWRVRSSWHIPDRSVLVLGTIAGLIVPVTVFSTMIGVAPTATVDKQSIIAFSVILTAMIYLALVLTYIEARMQQTAQGTPWATIALVFLCALVSTMGFIEVALDIGFVRNEFLVGVLETRASSTFANPNWFALCLAPFVFAAIHLAMEKRVRTAQILIAFATVGFIASGSRSAIWALGMSIILFMILGGSSGPRIRVPVMRSVWALVTGGVVGVIAGGVAAMAMGTTAIERYCALLFRMVAWPLLMWTTSSTFESIWGRFNLATLYEMERRSVGSGVVDSAYLFLYGTNPLVLALLLFVLVGVTNIAISRWRQMPTPDACLKLAICCFIVLSGFIGQVYWAFPVWISIAVLLGWTLIDDEGPRARIPSHTGDASTAAHA